MIAIFMLDDRKGMMFNHRRQSRDRQVIQRILQLAEGRIIRMSPYTATLFEGESSDAHVISSSHFYEEAGDNDFCIFEETLPDEIGQIKEMIIFNVDLENGTWFRERAEEFQGTSHEKITMEHYIRR